MEDQGGNMTFTYVDPLKVEVKVEVGDYNPWYVENASAFLKYCCPECEYKNGTLESFAGHALQNHENSRVLFANKGKMETRFLDYTKTKYLKEISSIDEMNDKIEFPCWQNMKHGQSRREHTAMKSLTNVFFSTRFLRVSVCVHGRNMNNELLNFAMIRILLFAIYVQEVGTRLFESRVDI